MPPRKKSSPKAKSPRNSKSSRARSKPVKKASLSADARKQKLQTLKEELFGEMLTAAEVAEILEVHPRTVGEYIRDGKLQAIQLGGGWRVSEASLREFVKWLTEVRPPTGSKGMFERFTDRARRVIVLSQEEARGLQHNYIGTEHILLGLISEGQGVGALALSNLGVPLKEARKEVKEMIGTGSTKPTGHLPFTARARKVLEMSLREASNLGDNYIGTEHIALALFQEGDGVGAQVLQKFGVTEPLLREKIMSLLSGYKAKVPVTQYKLPKQEK
ncbi:MAG: helix-turn-helix domain-containing protein [Actinobacteria bacterium]|nr:helix-turn-helix domain-containing protein [Actinomycetota bacterium]